MKLNANYVIKEVLDFYFAVAVNNKDDKSTTTINLGNETTKRIFELIQQGNDIDAIVSQMLTEYDVEEPLLRSEVSRVIKQLQDEGVLEENIF